MRHVWSLIAGILITPLAWFLIAFGQGAMSRGQASDGVQDDVILGGLLIIGVGLLLGLVSSLRTSPVGALVGGLIFVGAAAFALIRPIDALEVFSREVVLGDYKTNIADPLNHGTLAVAGGMLLIAVFSAARWRSGSRDDTTAEPGSPVSPPPAPGQWEPFTQTGVTSATTDTAESKTS